MRDEIISTVFFTGVAVLAVFGCMFLGMDFRHFKEIASHCDKHGYIQNETTRIQCRVEKP